LRPTGDANVRVASGREDLVCLWTSEGASIRITEILEIATGSLAWHFARAQDKKVSPKGAGMGRAFGAPEPTEHGQVCFFQFLALWGWPHVNHGTRQGKKSKTRASTLTFLSRTHFAHEAQALLFSSQWAR
jgi:hypothetical protein